MNTLNLNDVCNYVNENIDYFHENRLNAISKLSLNSLIKKNPYLYKAKNINNANDLIVNLLSAFLSSSEEKMFGDFLEDLAIFIASTTCNGRKSEAQGVDLDMVKDETYYIISIKSGPNWGNSSQQKKLQQDFQISTKVLKQARKISKVEAILGICYGKTKTSYLHGYWKLVGQNFWYFISNDKNLYTDIIEPIGFRAKEHNDRYENEKSKIVNRLSHEFIEEFCNKDYSINWKKVVQFNSGNYDLDKYNI